MLVHHGVCCKRCGSYVVIILVRTYICEWYMATLVVNNGHQKDMFLDEIGLRAHYMDTILGSIARTIGRIYVITSRERQSPL